MQTLRHPVHGERGIALVSAVLVILMCSVLMAAFMSSVLQERGGAANTQAARASLFAADAGVRTARQILSNTARTKLDSLTNAWSGAGPIITDPAGIFASLPATISSSDPGFAASISVAFDGSTIAATQQTFDYRYTITADGSSGGQARRSVKSSGVLRVSASRGSFTDYLVYTNQHTTPSGGSIWFTSASHFDGRVHSNGRLRFAYQPTFEDLVTSVSPQATYYGDGDNVTLDADRNGDIDVPDFEGGFQRGAPNIALPDNAYSQLNAALGLSVTSTLEPDASVINTQLGLGTSSSAPADGIYVVHAGGAMCGGLYVQGDLDQCLMTVDAQGRQVYRLQQGATTRTITVDRVNNSTSVLTGSSTTTYAGVPRGVLYVSGSLNDLRGPDRVSGNVVPAVAEHTQLLITAEEDIILKRDLTCTNYDAGDNVVGLFSSDGSVRVSTSAPDNMRLDAFVMAAASDGSFRVDDHGSGSPRGDFFLRGGMVTEFYGAFGTFNGEERRSGYGRRFTYDRRGIIPPYFPTTNRFEANQPTARTMTWVEI